MGAWLAAVVTGVLLAASFPPFGIAPLVWIALAPLLTWLPETRALGRFALGTVAGMVWAAGTVGFWLYPAVRTYLATGPVAAVFLTAIAGWLYGALYLALFAFVHPFLPRPRWLSGPCAWVLLEQMRGHAFAGAPWALFGHSQQAFLPLAQLAEIGGVPALSFLVVVPSMALTEPRGRRAPGLIFAAVGLLAATLFGRLRIDQLSAPSATPPTASIQVVGGHNATGDPLAAYVSATRAAVPATLTVWPEAAVPSYLQDNSGAAALLADVARRHGWLLVGALRHEGRGPLRRYFNSALLLDPLGEPRGRYDKRLLVPGAERTPLPLLPSVERPFTPGPSDPSPLAAGSLRVGPLICWEAAFPGPAREYARRGATVLVNLTSDQDLGRGAMQLLAFTRFRAIETRRWLVRASGTGPTYLVDPVGRVSRAERLEISLAPPGTDTFYVRHGDLIPWAAGFILLLLGGGHRLSRRIFR